MLELKFIYRDVGFFPYAVNIHGCMDIRRCCEGPDREISHADENVSLGVQNINVEFSDAAVFRIPLGRDRVCIARLGERFYQCHFAQYKRDIRSPGCLPVQQSAHGLQRAVCECGMKSVVSETVSK